MCKILGVGGRRKGVGRIQKRRTRAEVVGGHRLLPDQRSPTSGRPCPGDQQSLAGRGPPPGPLGTEVFFFFFFFKSFLRPLHVARAWASWGGWVYNTPFFEACPYTWKCNSSKIHGEWRFHFFPKKNFLNLVHTWTFLSTIGIFVS
jgi:hypothetical protein